MNFKSYIISLASLVFFLPVSAIQPDADGWYRISVASELREIATIVNNGSEALNICLENNIDLGGQNWTPIGNDTNRFSGIFEGNGHVISNMTVDVVGPAGLFGTVYTGEFRNLILDSSCSVKGTKYAGGLIGHSIQGAVNISRVGVECDVTCSGEAAAGLIGNANSGSRCNIYDCYTTGHIKAASDAAAFAGWLGNLNAEVKNCWSSSVVEGFQNQGRYLARYSSIDMSNCESVNGTQAKKLSSADINSGALAWRMNNANPAGVWLQTLGTDSHPYPCGNHWHVYATDAGFDCVGDAASFARFRSYTILKEKEYAQGVIACKSIVDNYLTQLNRLESIGDFDSFIAAMGELEADKAALKESAEAYGLYISFCEAAAGAIGDAAGDSEAFRTLRSYLKENVAPGQTFVNGSYPYILGTRTLSDAEIIAEQNRVRAQSRPVILASCAPGSDITFLLDNADFGNGLEGWSLVADYVPAIETVEQSAPLLVLDKGSFTLERTIEGVRDGVYLLTMSGATSAGSDIFNNLHTGFVSVNGSCNYLKTLGDDAVAAENAKPGVNCIVDGDGKDRVYLDGDREGYVPASTVGYSRAFGAGRYLNHVIAEVSGGKLQIKIYNNGLGGIPARTCIGGIRLYFIGSNASDAVGLDDALAAYGERARSLLDYQPGPGDDAGMYPGFGDNVRVKLIEGLAEVTEGSVAERLTGVKHLSEAFASAHESRKSYKTPDFDKVTLRIMTYNIPYGNINESDGNGRNTWRNRCNEIVKYLSDVKPDMLGMQEPVRVGLIDILKDLKGYAMVGEGRNGGDGGEFSPIIYNATRLYVIAHDTFWLTDTPDTPSKLEISKHKRVATWALFEDVLTGTRLLYFNTHLSYDSEEVREAQIRILKEHMASLRARFGEDIPVMLTGDFNMKDNEENYNFVLHHKLKMRDMWATVADKADNCPDHNFGKIDYIYTSWNVYGSKVNWDYRNTPDGFWMSDHDPLWADIHFERTLEGDVRTAIYKAWTLVGKSKRYNATTVPLIESASQLSSDGYDTALGGYDSLLDGDQATYLQSSSSAAVNDVHYLQVALKRDISDFFFKFSSRTKEIGRQDRWNHIAVTGSADGKDWKLVHQLFDFGADDISAQFSENIALREPYKYLRFNIIRTPRMFIRNGFPQYSVAEFQMYENQVSSDSPYLKEADVAAAATELESAIDDAESALENGTLTEAHLRRLQSGIKSMEETGVNSVEMPEIVNPAGNCRYWRLDGTPYTGGAGLIIGEDGSKTVTRH